MTATGNQLTIDGVNLSVGDRILVKDETTPSRNGIYALTSIGGSKAQLDRVSDFNASGVAAGYRALVTEGTASAGKVFRLTGTVTTLNTTAVLWAYYATYTTPGVATFAITQVNGSNWVSLASGAKLALPPSASVTLKVQGTLAASVTPNEALANQARVFWASADSTVSGRRDGSDVPSPTSNTLDGSKVNNYAVASTASTLVPQMTGVKSVFSIDQPPAGLGGTQVAIGANVTYALKVTLPEGLSPDLTVVDQIPAGMSYVSSSVVKTVAGSGGLLTADFAGSVPAPTVTVNGGNPTFTFGSITVTGDNNANNNSFLILVTAQVLDVPGNQGTIPTILGNTATFDISSDGVSVVSSGPINVTVVEPNLGLTKSITPSSGDAQNTVTVTLVANNSGTADAYTVNLQDTLTAANFDLTTVNYGTSGVNYPAGFTPAYNSGSGLLSYTGGTIAKSTAATFTFTVKLARSVVPGSTLTNTATIPQARTLPGGGGRLEPTVSASGTINIYAHSLSGFVYADANNDGTKQAGETGLSGVTVTVDGTDLIGNAVHLSTNTAGDGSYLFPNLPPGSFTVTRATTPVRLPGWPGNRRLDLWRHGHQYHR